MKQFTFGLLVAGLALTAACSSDSPTAQPGKVTSTTSSPAAPKIEVTSLSPADRWVSAAVQVTNPTAEPFRFEWPKFTVTMPDGRVVTSSGHEDLTYALVDAGGTLVDGGNFCFQPADCYEGKFIPGHYVVSYDGKVLKEADL